MLSAALLTACMPAQLRPSWAIYPLARHQPHDGLAVVSQPNGYGLHIWLETDTHEPGLCRPRWIVDGSRLFNGNGTAPFSSGLATRAEFFEAVARADVRRALRVELEQLCASRASGSTWQWQEPPRNATEVVSPSFSLLDDQPPAGDPDQLRQEEAALAGSGEPGATPPPPSAASGR
jgi:hypothetical protein